MPKFIKNSVLQVSIECRKLEDRMKREGLYTYLSRQFYIDEVAKITGLTKSTVKAYIIESTRRGIKIN